MVPEQGAKPSVGGSTPEFSVPLRLAAITGSPAWNSPIYVEPFANVLDFQNESNKAFLLSTDERAAENIEMFTKDGRSGNTISGTWTHSGDLYVCEFDIDFVYWVDGVPITIIDNTTGAQWVVYRTNMA